MQEHEASEPEALPCHGKLRFDTQEEASSAGVVAEHRFDTKVKPYLCQYCGWWHLASDYDQ